MQNYVCINFVGMKKAILIGAILLLCLEGVYSQNSVKNIDMENRAEIYIAGGCYWGTEHFLKQINGIEKTEVGFANGNSENPTYEDVCKGGTGHCEVVKVQYNSSIVSLETILELFYLTIDPTSVNKQGGDVGTQYRTGIYYTNSENIPVIENSINQLAKKYSEPIAIEVMALQNYYSAEGAHQDYLDKNEDGYCHIDPKLFSFAKKANAKVKYSKKNEEELKGNLSDIQFSVTQNNATEPAFKNEYWDKFEEGIYVDITTGEPLFISTDKFESGCGWPSFSKPISDNLIVEKEDNSVGMTRVEVRSKLGDSHLGHIFNDGPEEFGSMRYCINSASLKFIPKAEMLDMNYGAYIHLLE